MEEEDRKQKEKEAAAKAAKEASEEKENAIGKYNKKIEAAKKALSPEPEGPRSQALSPEPHLLTELSLR